MVYFCDYLRYLIFDKLSVDKTFTNKLEYLLVVTLSGGNTQLVSDKKPMCAIFPIEFKPETSSSQSMIAFGPGVHSFLTGFLALLKP